MPAVTVPAVAPGIDKAPVGPITAVGCPGVATVVVEPAVDDRTPPVGVGMPPVTLTVDAGFWPGTAATGIEVVACPEAGEVGWPIWLGCVDGIGVGVPVTPLVGELAPVVPSEEAAGVEVVPGVLPKPLNQPPPPPPPLPEPLAPLVSAEAAPVAAPVLAAPRFLYHR